MPDVGLVVSGFDGTMTAWDPTGEPLIARVLRGKPRGGGLYSPDGSRLALVDNSDGVRLYRVPGLQLIASLSISGPGTRGALAISTPAAFSPDSRVLAIGDRFGELIQLFDAATSGLGDCLPIVADAARRLNAPAQLTFSPDGRTIAAVSFRSGPRRQCDRRRNPASAPARPAGSHCVLRDVPT